MKEAHKNLPIWHDQVPRFSLMDSTPSDFYGSVKRMSEQKHKMNIKLQNSNLDLGKDFEKNQETLREGNAEYKSSSPQLKKIHTIHIDDSIGQIPMLEPQTSLLAEHNRLKMEPQPSLLME